MRLPPETARLISSVRKTGASYRTSRSQYPGGRCSSLGIDDGRRTVAEDLARMTPETTRARVTTVPILAYHSVSWDPPSWIGSLSVTPAAFRRHLELIAEAEATALYVSDFVDAIIRGSGLPEHPVLLTFDDGFSDFRGEAWPALREAGFAATLYVTTGFLQGLHRAPGLKRPPGKWLAADALPQLHEQGVEIGGHSHTHPHLDTLSLEATRREITLCRTALERLLQAPVRSFAYPHGFHSRSVRELVRESGFDSACAVKNRLSSSADDPFALARLTVRSTTTPAEVAAWLSGHGAEVAPSGELLRTRAWRTYRRGRAIVQRRPGTDWE
jgi:peptidoglycan/xylan/chitin deacetylase (PgdA/CDA1 family)